MIKRILWATALFALVGSGSAFAQDNPSEVHGKVTKTITAESKAQEGADTWGYDKQTILAEIRDLKYRVTWKQYRQKKYKVYNEGVKEEIKNLQFKKEEINKLREQIDPYLEEVVDRIEAFVKKDLPFLAAERQNRIDALRKVLNNYKMQPSEKLNYIVSNGLKIETDYGKVIEPQEDVKLNINGVETRVNTMRLGRVAMYYMTNDRKEIGMFNRQSGKWESLPESQLKEFKTAFDMVTGTRTAEIVELPLGAI
jgi:hypothetical protein